MIILFIYLSPQISSHHRTLLLSPYTGGQLELQVVSMNVLVMEIVLCGLEAKIMKM